MQFSVGVEYALHCLLYLVDLPQGKSVGVKDMATFQGVSETYLSKVFTKLRKAGLVRAISGVKGGYELSRPADEISFWDVVEAIEGSSHMFQCIEVRQNNILLDKENLPETYTSKCPCLIKVVMQDAEEQMRNHLRAKTLGWLSQSVAKKLDPKQTQATIDWFMK